MTAISFDWQGSFSRKAKRILERKMQRSTEYFFRYAPAVPAEILYRCFETNPGSDLVRAIKLSNGGSGVRLSPVGVRVIVRAEGTQGVLAQMIVRGWTDQELAFLIENGPYMRTRVADKPMKVSHETPSVPLESEALHQNPPSSEVEVLAEDPLPALAPVKVLNRTTVRMKTSAYEKLVKAGVAEDEINRLKETLASIISREVREARLCEVPNTLQVPVRKITEAIMDHMKLPYNAAGNYRGTIANFYATRIALFALKNSDGPSVDDEAIYTDWFFDCHAVLDFVGGQNKLEALTIHRESEVSDRKAREATPKVAAPPAVEVEAAIKKGFLPDESLFFMVLRTLEGRQEAAAELKLARENQSAQQGIVAELRAKLELAEQQMVVAADLVLQAEAKVTSFALSKEVLAQVFAARDRLDQLVSDLGCM